MATADNGQMNRPLRALSAFVADAALITVFAALGRASHDGDPLGPGPFTTAWPFLAALAGAWLITRAWRRPSAVLRSGLPVWALTVMGGMLLRMVSGQGIALAFVLVATATLLVLLVGWRALAAAVGSLRRRAISR